MVAQGTAPGQPGANHAFPVHLAAVLKKVKQKLQSEGVILRQHGAGARTRLGEHHRDKATTGTGADHEPAAGLEVAKVLPSVPERFLRNRSTSSEA